MLYYYIGQFWFHVKHPLCGTADYKEQDGRDGIYTFQQNG